MIVKQIMNDSFIESQKYFVVGPPRSGTTLLYSMICGKHYIPECSIVSSLMKLFDEFLRYSDRSRFQYYGHNRTNTAEIFRKPIFDFLYSASVISGSESHEYQVFKDPNLTLYANYFPLFFGDKYKIIVCIRDPRDVIRSYFLVLQKRHRNETREYDLLNEAVDTIFPYFHAIGNIEQEILEKAYFVKYEDVVTQDTEAIDGLEEFVGFSLNRRGFQENIDYGFDTDSEFHSDLFGKRITASSIGGYQEIFTSHQIRKIEDTFFYYLQLYNYIDQETSKAAMEETSSKSLD